MRRASNLLGKQMLLARRLCEAGCGFVTVSDCGWDMHANGNSPKNMGGMQLARPAGRSRRRRVHRRRRSARPDATRSCWSSPARWAARRGSTTNGGRDHYGNLTPLLLCRRRPEDGPGDRPVRPQRQRAPRPSPTTPQHLLATVMHTLFDVGQLRVARGVPGELIRAASEEEPIAELFCMPRFVCRSALPADRTA